MQTMNERLSTNQTAAPTKRTKGLGGVSLAGECDG